MTKGKTKYDKLKITARTLILYFHFDVIAFDHDFVTWNAFLRWWPQNSAGFEIEIRTVPRTGNPGALNVAFRQRSATVRAGVADGIVSSLAHGESGHLRLGFGFHTFEIVPRAIVRLRRKLPDVEVSLQDMSTSEQVEGLLGDKLDLGFIRLTAIKRLTTLPLMQDRMIIVTSRSQGFPSAIKLASLCEHPFVLISHERSPTFYGHVLELCAKHGFNPRVVQEVPEITTVLALVHAGLGVSMIPASFSNSRFEGIHTHPISDRAAEWTVAAAWRKGDSNPLIPRFLDLLKTKSSE